MDDDELKTMMQKKYPNKNGVPDYVIKCYLGLRPELIDIASRIAPRSDLFAVADMFTHIDHCFGFHDEHGNLVDWAKDKVSY